ncbi:sensor histidine kinase [Nonomuraea polychroma]|uniref:sensor histidine kinase n=1 Tax=Nonomuraea polychroma TaxID=46176 RepID=UPI0019D43743|nr:histidine kinase [Nonomuraea polychroma]
MDETHPFFARRLSRGQLILLDLVAGLVTAFVFFTSTANATALPPWMRIALPFALGLPLAARRLWPLSVFFLTLVLAIFAGLIGAVGFPYFAPAYALYVVALTNRAGTLLPVSAIGTLSLLTIVGLAVAGAPRQHAPEWLLNLDQPLMGIAAMGSAWTIGRAVHERRGFAARDAERLAAQAVTDERLRIARELHDVVTHSVGLIAVKAGVANHVMATRPEEAHDALRVIETASRSALVEMRHLLGVLRSAEVPDLGPAPGLGGLEGLVQRTRLAGVEVQFELRMEERDGGRVAGGRGVEGRGGGRAGDGVGVGVRDGGRIADGVGVEGRGGGRAGDGQGAGDAHARAGHVYDGGGAPGSEVRRVRLPEGVELAVYRIVQEALTNVVKHASPARCRVSVVADGRDVRIEVIDDGPGRRTLPAEEGDGHGLIGMRERVTVYGGTFEAGRLPGRGFRVLATLPYGEGA